MPVLRGVAAPLVGVVLSAGFFVISRRLDEVVRGDQLGPGFWPRLVLVGLALACGAKLLGALRRRPLAAPAPVVTLDAETEARVEISWGLLAAAIGLIVLYVVATPVAGFPLATAAFIVVFMRLAGARAPATMVATAILGTVALLYLFVKLVYLPLPKGAGPFEALTIALYRALRIF